MTNSDLLEELLQECWSLGIIDEVRAEAKARTDVAKTTLEILEAYEDAVKKVKKKFEKRDRF